MCIRIQDTIGFIIGRVSETNTRYSQVVHQQTGLYSIPLSHGKRMEYVQSKYKQVYLITFMCFFFFYCCCFITELNNYNNNFVKQKHLQQEKRNSIFLFKKFIIDN